MSYYKNMDFEEYANELNIEVLEALLKYYKWEDYEYWTRNNIKVHQKKIDIINKIIEAKKK